MSSMPQNQRIHMTAGGLKHVYSMPGPRQLPFLWNVQELASLRWPQPHLMFLKWSRQMAHCTGARKAWC